MATSSGFWEDAAGEVASYSLINGRSPNRYHLRRIFRTRGMREYAELLTTLLGDAVPASSASVTISQVQAARDVNANVQGGVRTIESKERVGLLIDSGVNDASANTARAVTAADVTAIQSDIRGGDKIERAPTNGSGTITYPADASGNGGGGKGEYV